MSHTRTSPGTGARNRPTNTSLAKASRLLHAVAHEFPTGGTLSRIARTVSMNTATVHRLLTALASEGLLTFDPYQKTYHIGFGLLEIAESAQAVAPDLQLRHQLKPLLNRISLRSEETTYLSVRSSRDALCIDVAEGTYPVSTNTLVPGSRRPLGVGAGSVALLASLPEDESAELILQNTGRFERYSGISARDVEDAVTECRRRGYALNQGRIVPEIAAVGLAFQVPGSRQTVAITVASVLSRMHSERRGEVISIILDEVRRLASRPTIHE
jgi:DNA-binding IclR family transcriptional regulator